MKTIERWVERPGLGSLKGICRMLFVAACVLSLIFGFIAVLVVIREWLGAGSWFVLVAIFGPPFIYALIPEKDSDDRDNHTLG